MKHSLVDVWTASYLEVGLLVLSVLEDGSDLIFLSVGSLPSSESSLEELGGSLVELAVFDLVKFECSLLVSGQTADGSDNLSDEGSS